MLSGKDKQGAFEAMLDNLKDQGALAGFGAFVFIAQVTQQRQIAQIEGISEQFVDRVRILETLLQKADENVRDHQFHIIELESALEKEKRKVNIKEAAGASGASKSLYFSLMRQKPSDVVASEIGRRSVSG